MNARSDIRGSATGLGNEKPRRYSRAWWRESFAELGPLWAVCGCHFFTLGAASSSLTVQAMALVLSSTAAIMLLLALQHLFRSHRLQHV